MTEDTQSSEERRIELKIWKSHMDRRMDDQDQTLNKIDRKLDTHIGNTENWKSELRPLIDAEKSRQERRNTAIWVGSALKWIAGVLTAILLAYAAWHSK